MSRAPAARFIPSHSRRLPATAPGREPQTPGGFQVSKFKKTCAHPGRPKRNRLATGQGVMSVLHQPHWLSPSEITRLPARVMLLRATRRRGQPGAKGIYARIAGGRSGGAHGAP